MIRRSPPRLLILFTACVVGNAFAGVALADEPKTGEGAAGTVQVQIQVVAEKAEKGGGLAVRLGDGSDFWLGLALEPKDGRLKVEQVLPNSPAAKAGIKPKDVLLASGETAVKELADLQKLVQSSGGKPFALKFLRAGKETVIEVTPERRQAGQVTVIGEGNEAGDAIKRQIQLRLQQPTEQARQQAEAAKNPRGSGWQVMAAPQVMAAMPFPEQLEVAI